MKVPFLHSITGFTRTFKHLDGEEMEVTRNELTRPDNQITIKEKGFPDQRSGKRGDLIVKFSIDMPSFTDNQLDQWEDFFNRHRL